MATNITDLNFDEAGNDIHVIAVNNDDYTCDAIEFTTNGVMLQRDTVDVVFIPWCNVARIYQEI